jgi:hypothetical protein
MLIVLLSSGYSARDVSWATMAALITAMFAANVSACSVLPFCVASESAIWLARPSDASAVIRSVSISVRAFAGR